MEFKQMWVLKNKVIQFPVQIDPGIEPGLLRLTVMKLIITPQLGFKQR